MKKILSIFILSFMFIFSINAQELVSSNGAYYSGASGSISWSVGEVVITTISDGTDTLTQGFHQGRYDFVTIEENNIGDVDIQVYPNPVQDFINIRIESLDLSALSYVLYDSQGKLLYQAKVNSDISKINMDKYPTGNYIITVYQGNTTVESIQIIKTY